ncbi:MAG TPA: hypothetical protein ENG03_10530 [Thioploca sp.]|nr:MAG: hypothetical protein B6247_28480 [Beggiatoa sp. 4572_84]RKZ54754.1 MAG: hypothetical protein DRR08_26085 [Gammaproteobacteria bacterium]HDN27510.1 hypothetical protein [Thioploca sp.]
MKIKLYADENFRKPTVEELRRLGYDILTAYEAGQANQDIPDEEVLAFAKQQKRAVITYNRKHFIKLHHHIKEHTGIIVCTEDHHDQRLAKNSHSQLTTHISLDNKLIRVNKP